MIYFYASIGLLFLLNLIFKVKNTESIIYRAKPIALIVLSIIYLGFLSYDNYKFYFAQNSISNGIDKEFMLDIQNNSNYELNLRFLTLSDNEEKYKRYLLNKIKVNEPNNLLQEIKISPNKKSSFSFRIPYTSYLLIQDLNSKKGLKVYRTDIKMRIYATDFKEINEKVIESKWYEINLIVSNFAFYFVIIFLFTELPKKIIPKTIMLIFLLILFIITSYNLYILVRLLGVI